MIYRAKFTTPSTVHWTTMATTRPQRRAASSSTKVLLCRCYHTGEDCGQRVGTLISTACSCHKEPKDLVIAHLCRLLLWSKHKRSCWEKVEGRWPPATHCSRMPGRQRLRRGRWGVRHSKAPRAVIRTSTEVNGPGPESDPVGEGGPPSPERTNNWGRPGAWKLS